MPRYAVRPPCQGISRLGSAAGVLALAIAASSGFGCDDTVDTAAVRDPSVEAPKTPSLPRVKWLDPRDSTAPEQWLASREAKVDLEDHDPKVLALRDELTLAAKRFHDKPRMIANRAVQLEQMLAAAGIVEHAPELIAILSSVAADGHPREGFGAICQHYYNLRQQGLDRETALAQLKATSLLDVYKVSHG
jgi:hypothetical protein